MTNPLPNVTARGVLAASRALFMLLAALLAPLMAQYLFGPGVDASTWGLFLVVGALASLLVSRLVVTVEGTARPALRVFLRGALVGGGAGAAAGLAWATFVHDWGADRHALAALFGAIYGVATGAAFGALFALWTSRARAALARPSAIASQRLAMEAGFALALAGVVGSALYRVEALHAASMGAAAAGAVVILAATVRVMRFKSLLATIARGDGEFQVVERDAGTQAPALAWAPVLDRVVVRATSPTNVEPPPFRANNPAAEVAVIPADLALVRRALGAAVAFGFVALASTGLLQAGAVLFSCAAGCASGGCGGCTH